MSTFALLVSLLTNRGNSGASFYTLQNLYSLESLGHIANIHQPWRDTCFGHKSLYFLLLYERNNTFDYNEMERVFPEFCFFLQLDALNDVSYHFLRFP